MEYVLKLLGDAPVKTVVLVIGAAIFLYGCYKKIEKYFSEKAVREKENDERLHKVIAQAENYPKWRQQSITIREQLNASIGDLGDKMDSINAAIEELRKENGVNRASVRRYRILRFDDEIRHEERHTKEHFDQILKDITEYEKYCSEHREYKNNKAVLAIKNIKRVYEKCANEGTFL